MSTDHEKVMLGCTGISINPNILTESKFDEPVIALASMSLPDISNYFQDKVFALKLESSPRLHNVRTGQLYATVFRDFLTGKEHVDIFLGKYLLKSPIVIPQEDFLYAECEWITPIRSRVFDEITGRVFDIDDLIEEKIRAATLELYTYEQRLETFVECDRKFFSSERFGRELCRECVRFFQDELNRQIKQGELFKKTAAPNYFTKRLTEKIGDSRKIVNHLNGYL